MYEEGEWENQSAHARNERKDDSLTFEIYTSVLEKL